MTTQVNARLPKLTTGQIDEIVEAYGLTQTQIMILAIDRLARELDERVDFETAIYAKAEARAMFEDKSNSVKHFG